METEKIVQQLNERFAEPLPEFYSRRIIFWHDEERQYEDKLSEVVLENAKVVALTGGNTFAIKKLLSYDDVESNFLVYNPLTFNEPDENWLIDMEFYNEDFRSDLVSVWMNELVIAPTVVMRKAVKDYQKFFKAKDRRAKIKSQESNICSPAQLHLAVMAAICREKKAIPNNILYAVLCEDLNMDNNEYYQDMVEYNAKDAFWAMVAQGTGYIRENPSLEELAMHILVTAATRTMVDDHLEGLEKFISWQHQAYCYDFISDWMHSGDLQRLYKVGRLVENKAKLVQRFEKLEIRDLLNTECFPCVNEIILSKLMTEISDHIIDTDVINPIIEKRRTCIWHESFADYYEGIQQVANMHEFYKENSGGFHTVEPKNVWQEYTEKYYKMDTYYRLFQMSFQKSLENPHLLLDDLFKQVVDKVEGLYTHWFLGELGSNWNHACAEDFENYGRALEVPQQNDFYRLKVDSSDTKIFVVISDALRYEVGVSLTEQLKRESTDKVSLGSMQSIFPSITKFGMAALLPHKELSVEVNNGVLNVLADGKSTIGTANREKILRDANEKSVALQYKDIKGLKRDEKSALVKGMDVVYIYHDAIDEAGHVSEDSVFAACDKAISDIKNIIRIIVNDFNGTNIIITADHGFLYTYSPLGESDKVGKESFKGQDVECGRRYAIVEKTAEPEYLIPVKFFEDKTDYAGYAPRENIRIKMNGGGMNYVHGGTCLQEMVIPVIEYKYVRNDSAEYRRNKNKYDTKPVIVNLLSANRKVSNMIFSLNFYQTEPVSEKREAATYYAYFEDASGNKVSDIQKIIADKDGENGNDRVFRCTFNLKSVEYNKQKPYYLVIASEDGLQKPQKEEFYIDIAFTASDFNFFE